MKKQLTLFALLFSATFAFGQTQFGAGISYWDNFGVQGRAILDLDIENIDIVPSASLYFFDGGTALALDGDVTYEITEISDGIPLYGKGGLNFTRVSGNGSSDTELGLNLGAGVRFSGSFYGELQYRTTYNGDLVLNVGYYF